MGILEKIKIGNQTPDPLTYSLASILNERSQLQYILNSPYFDQALLKDSSCSQNVSVYKNHLVSTTSKAQLLKSNTQFLFLQIFFSAIIISIGFIL